MKIRVERQSFMGFAMALFVFSLMAYQSSHRLFEHHDDEEGEHEECSLCDWQFAPVEACAFIIAPINIAIYNCAYSTEFTEQVSSFTLFSFDGRGPPKA
ncbi:MAG: hypothetical protein RL106_509 [Bacteroidota bacterium]